MTKYKLVPVTPTPEMIAAGAKCEYFEGGYGCEAHEFWEEMIAAAPVVDDGREAMRKECLAAVNALYDKMNKFAPLYPERRVLIDVATMLSGIK